MFGHVKEMSGNGCFKDPLGTDIEVAKAQVAKGEALGMFGHAITYRQVAEIAVKGDASAKIVAQAFPATNNPADGRMAVALGASMSVNAATKQPALAMKFIAYLMEPKNTAAYAVTSGQPPALPNDFYQPKACAWPFSMGFRTPPSAPHGS